MDTTKTAVVTVLIGVLVAGGSFYIGYSMNPSRTGPAAIEGVPENAVQYIGDIESFDGSTLIILLDTGERRTVSLNEDTSVVVDVVATDFSTLTPGTPIIVSAFTQADGSLYTDYVTVMTE